MAVGPIQSRDSAALGPILRDMLATNLGRLDGLSVVSLSRLLELMPAGDSETPLVTKAAARRAGANEIIEGSLDFVRRDLIVNLRRVDIRSGVVVQGYTMRAGDLLSLTDSITGALAIDLGLDAPTGAAASVRRRSSVASALYEQGRRAFHSGNLQSAAQLMYAALGRDSSLAMAAAYAWRASLATNNVEAARRDLPAVKRLAARAPDHERLVIEAMIARYGNLPLTEFRTSARLLATRFPDDPEGQILLGQALSSGGEWGSAIEAYNRAIATDSAAGSIGELYCRLCEASVLLIETYLWIDSAAAAEHGARRLIALRPREATGWFLLAEPLLRQGRRREAEAANATAARIAGGGPVYYHALNRDLIRSGRLEELEERALAELRTSPPEMMGEWPWLLSFALRNQGRLRELHELGTTGRVPGTNRKLPGYPEPTLLALVALEGGDPMESARIFMGMVKGDRAMNDGLGAVSRNLSWHMTLAGTAFAAAGDTAMVRKLADSVMRIGQQSSIARDYRLPHFLNGLLLQRQNRHAEAVEAFRRAMHSPTDGYTRINFEQARSLMALQRYTEAIAVLQPALRGGVDGSNTYITHTELHEALAHAFHGAGRLDSARVHYAAVERAWRRADRQFADRYALARTRAGLGS
jgi:tetratricopeptide (TPR) repeat protein